MTNPITYTLKYMFLSVTNAFVSFKIEQKIGPLFAGLVSYLLDFIIKQIDLKVQQQNFTTFYQEKL
jgi:hypothetical protein